MLYTSAKSEADVQVTCPRCGAKATIQGEGNFPEQYSLLPVESDFRQKCEALADRLPNEPSLEEWDCPDLSTAITTKIDGP